MRVAQRRPHGLRITNVIDVVALCSCCERVQAAIGLLSLFACLVANGRPNQQRIMRVKAPRVLMHIRFVAILAQVCWKWPARVP